MPSKPRKRQGKKSKKRKFRQGFAITSAHGQEGSQSYKPAPPAKAIAAKPRPAASQYPYIGSELRRIAILVGVMVVILVVLYFVIP